jgi:hypothetical protein
MFTQEDLSVMSLDKVWNENGKRAFPHNWQDTEFAKVGGRGVSLILSSDTDIGGPT